MSEYTEPTGTEPIHAVGMGDFEGEEREWANNYRDGGRCCYPDCGKPISNGAKTCQPHQMWYRNQIAAKMKRLCELARERRGTQ